MGKKYLLFVVLQGIFAFSALGEDYAVSIPEVVTDAGFSFYKKFITSQDSSNCPYTPSCSQYMKDAVSESGLVGIIQGLERVRRCTKEEHSRGLYPVAANGKHYDPYSPELVKDFADSLLEEKFLDEAEREYKRYIYSKDSADPKDIFPLLDIYNIQNNKSGVFWLKSRFYETSPDDLKEKIRLVEGRLIFRDRLQKEFSAFYTEAQNDFTVFSVDFINLLTVSDWLLKGNFSEAAAISRKASLNNAIFAPLARECEAYSPKSPGAALALSGIVPGLGKLYGGTFGGFLSDFTAIGACTAGCVYTGIKSEWKDWRPYLFACMGATLFAVDLYGSWQNIKRVNAAKARRVYEEADKIYEKMY